MASLKVGSEKVPVLQDDEREIHDIQKLKDEVYALKQHVMTQKQNGHPVMAEGEAINVAPNLYDISPGLVRKILQDEPNVDSATRTLLHLLEQRQEGSLTGDQADKTFGLEMARLYFPSAVLEDLQSSGKADRALESSFSQ